MLNNKLKIYFLKKTVLLFSFVVTFSYLFAVSGDSTMNQIAANRILITVTAHKNIISLDADQGINQVKIISANPLNGLDFRDYPSLTILVEKDGNKIIEEKLMNFVKGRSKKKKIAFFESDEFVFTNFTNLRISIFDETNDLKKFQIDVGLFVR